MALQPEIINVDGTDRIDHVLEAMASFTERGRGWINIRPDVADELLAPQRSSLTQFFRRTSPQVALGTWMAPAIGPPESPQQIGVQHALGTRIVPLLDEWGLALPQGWRRRQDSPRRGLLVEVPEGESHEVVVRWLLGVTVAATQSETNGTWTLSVYQGRGG